MALLTAPRQSSSSWRCFGRRAQEELYTSKLEHPQMNAGRICPWGGRAALRRPPTERTSCPTLAADQRHWPLVMKVTRCALHLPQLSLSTFPSLFLSLRPSLGTETHRGKQANFATSAASYFPRLISSKLHAAVSGESVTDGLNDDVCWVIACSAEAFAGGKGGKLVCFKLPCLHSDPYTLNPKPIYPKSTPTSYSPIDARSLGLNPDLCSLNPYLNPIKTFLFRVTYYDFFTYIALKMVDGVNPAG